MKHLLLLFVVACGPVYAQGADDGGFDASVDAGPPSWTVRGIATQRSYADGVELGDVDGDGLLDVVTSYESGGGDDERGRAVAVALNPGPLGIALRADWRAVTVIDDTDGEAFEGANPVDIDADGDIDIIAAGGNTMRVCAQTSHLVFECEVLPSFPGADRFLFSVATDWDDDGDLDIIAASQTRFLLLFSQDAGAWSASLLALSKWPMRLLPDDIDGDGDVDLYVWQRQSLSDGQDVAAAGLYWLQQTSTGLVRHDIALGPAMAGCAADLDGDDDLDLVVPYEDGGLRLYERTGLATWAALDLPTPSGVSQTWTPKECATADLDGDGVLDLALYARDASPHAVWWSAGGTGYQTWTEVIGTAVVRKCDGPRIADLTGDGAPDLVLSDEIGGEGAAGVGVLLIESPL